MEQLGTEVALSLACWGATALLGAIAGKASERTRRIEAEKAERDRLHEAMQHGLRALLRREIIRAHDDHVVHGNPLSREELEHLQRSYSCYEQLGGNGSCTLLYHQTIDQDVDS